MLARLGMRLRMAVSDRYRVPWPTGLPGLGGKAIGLTTGITGRTVRCLRSLVDIQACRVRATSDRESLGRSWPQPPRREASQGARTTGREHSVGGLA